MFWTYVRGFFTWCQRQTQGCSLPARASGEFYRDCTHIKATEALYAALDILIVKVSDATRVREYESTSKVGRSW